MYHNHQHSARRLRLDRRALLLALAVVFVLAMTFAVMFGASTTVRAEENLQKRMHITSLTHGYSGYQRYEGITFNVTDADAFTTSATTAFVLRIDNNFATNSTALNYYLNGTQMANTSGKSTYTYDGEQYVATLASGSYGMSFYPYSKGTSNAYTYIVIPTSNFTNAANDTSLTVSNFTIAIRLKGIDAKYSTPDICLYNIYYTDSFTAEEDLAVNDLHLLYTPASDNYSYFDSGNTGIASEIINASYEQLRTVSATYGEHGTLTASAATAFDGEEVTFTVAPESGYVLNTLVVNGVDKANEVVNGVYTAAPDGADITAHATFKVEPYYVTMKAVNGTLVADKTEAEYGESVTFTLTPSTGCTFEKFEINGTEVTVSEGSYTVASVTEDIYAVATFTAPYTPTVSATHGTVTPDKATYSEGDTLVFTLTPDVGYRFESLTVNDVDKTDEVENGTYTLENAPTSLNVVATFTRLSFTVTVEEATHGSLSVDKDTALYGDAVTVTATGDNGYEVDVLTVNGTAMATENGVATITVTENVTLSATFKGALKINVTATHGTVVGNKAAYEPGDTVVLTAKPAAGYAFATMKVNGTDVTAKVNGYGQYVAGAISANIAVEATFTAVSEFSLEQGGKASIYDTWKGTVYAEYDAVNVSVMQQMTETDNKYIGLVTEALNADVGTARYIAVDLQNLSATYRTFYITVNGKAHSGTYYLVNRFGEVTKATGTAAQGVATARYTYFSNDTFNIGNASTEGFYGMAIIPLSSFGGEMTTIDKVAVYSITRNNTRARFNVGSIRLLQNADFDELVAPVLKDSQVIWKPAADNFTEYVHGENNWTHDIAKLEYLRAGDWLINNQEADNLGYDVYYVTVPQNMIGEDGYVDVKALGIKGIVMDVVNLNLTQNAFIFRIAGASSTSLTETGHSLWQTSVSGGYWQKVIYESGLVRTRVPGFLAYDESGNFTGSVYIPLSSDAFTSIGAESGFPTKLQPVFRIILGQNGIDIDNYLANITNIRFVTDDSAYQTSSIVMTGVGGTLAGSIGGVAVGSNANNNVVPGTEVSFVVRADNGYKLYYVRYTMNGKTTNVTPDANGNFTVSVTGDIVVSYYASEIEYKITYDLDGGENNEYNPSVYHLSDGTVTLLDPTKSKHTFLRWENENGEEVTEIDCSQMKDVTLKAVWKKNGGCGGVISASAVALLCAVVAVVAVVMIKRNKKGKENE